jgi:hypothetical protein
MTVAQARPLRAPAEPGIYRCARGINGKPIWYAWSADRKVVALHIVQAGEDEATIAADMRGAFRAHQRPKLELVKDAPSLSRRRHVLSPAALLGLLRRQGALPGPAPRQLSAGRG